MSRIRKIQKPLFDEIRGHILEEMMKYYNGDPLDISGSLIVQTFENMPTYLQQTLGFFDLKKEFAQNGWTIECDRLILEGDVVEHKLKVYHSEP